MKKYLTTISLLLILSTSTVFGKEVTKELARTVAINFLSERNIETNSLHFANPTLIKKEGIFLYYIFILEKGFILIAAENSIFPVLGYSLESNFHKNNLPPSFAFWMSQFEKLIFHISDTNLKPNEKILGAWQKYGSKDFNSSKIVEGVSPLLCSTWDQGCFYNTSFPEDGNGPCDHTYAGCVAVAMGQIMKYYNWPKTGTGENTISSPYGELTANFGNTSYSWIEMENYLNSESPSIAELLYHNAIAVNSVFIPPATGAYDYNIPPALINYYGYAETAQFIFKHNYFGDWEQLIRDELDKGRPLIYGGIDLEQLVGHTFICDGYQDNSFFHFNWGWGGQFNGYYYLDSLIVGGYHFDYQHDIVIGIEPDINGEVYPAENLTSEVEMRDVNLSWEAPSGTNSLELLGFNIYRNDTLLNKSIIDVTTYTDLNVPPGSHIYKVQSVFIGAGNGPSTSVETFISSISTKNNESFSIYPNPAKDKIYITVSANSQKINSIDVFDLSGKKVFSQNLTDMTNEILQVDLPKNMNGIYLLRLTYENNIYSKKLMIQSN